MAIFFNTRFDQHTGFRNTSSHAVELDGTHWRSVEHYVQAQRFDCETAREEIRNADYAFEAKSLARKRPEALREDWHDVRDQIMETALRAKFEKHENLACTLASTGDEELIEASPMSRYWGAGADGLGRNKLGEILMKIRSELRQTLQPMSG